MNRVRRQSGNSLEDGLRLQNVLCSANSGSANNSCRPGFVQLFLVLGQPCQRSVDGLLHCSLFWLHCLTMITSFADSVTEKIFLEDTH